MNTQKALLEENKTLQLRLAVAQEAVRNEQEKIVSLEQEISVLNEKVAVLEVLHFGPKSEKWTKEDEKQARLFNEAEDEAFRQCDEEEQKKVIATREVASYTRRKPRKQGRVSISKDLPREEVIYDIPEEEKVCACGTKKTEIGESVSERVKIIPSQVRVIRERRKKYVCKSCEGTEADEPGVVTAKGVRHLIRRSIADESFLAWSITEKFEFALPFYRQAKRLEYLGLKIPRATLSKHVIKAGYACKPLIELLKEYILSGPLINADETRLQVLDEPGRKATDKSWMWVFCGGMAGARAVVFQYDQSRSSEIPKGFLKGYRGNLQTDDYGAYHTAVKELNAEAEGDTSIKHVLCWSHSRSKFYKAWEVSKSPYAKKAIDFIKELFALEDLRDEFSVKGFTKQRKNRAGLIFEQMKPWLDGLYASTPPKSLLGKAIGYTLDNWEQLITYVDDPVITPSNNLAENSIRPYVIGRKNWLFSATPAGAETSAILYSLIETAKLNSLKPYDCLYYIFRKLPYAENREDFAKLLPHKINRDGLSS